MTWQPADRRSQDQQHVQANVQFPVEVRGYLCSLTWDGRSLAIWSLLRPRADVTVPGRQVASIAVSPLSGKFTVTTAAGARYRLRYWPGQGRRFRAFRDAVLSDVAAMG